jgi:ribosome-associated protein
VSRLDSAGPDLVQPDPDGHDDAVQGVPAAALAAAVAADDKLGHETVVLAMGELLGVVDAFVVTSGRNVRQVRTLVEEIEKRVKVDEGRSPVAVEGLRDGTWVLIDYGDFVVHVFMEETRDYYDLEHLWSGAPRVDWRERVPAPTG